MAKAKKAIKKLLADQETKSGVQKLLRYTTHSSNNAAPARRALDQLAEGFYQLMVLGEDEGLSETAQEILTVALNRLNNALDLRTKEIEIVMDKALRRQTRTSPVPETLAKAAALQTTTTVNMTSLAVTLRNQTALILEWSNLNWPQDETQPSRPLNLQQFHDWVQGFYDALTTLRVHLSANAPSRLVVPSDPTRGFATA